MYDDINNLSGETAISGDAPFEAFKGLIGKSIRGVGIDMIYEIWSISGWAVLEMYARVCKDKKGI